jgi:DNA-binding transcriptional MerR regulator
VVVAVPETSQENKRLAIRKLYYSIGEVQELTGVPAHVLRYWETEFAQLKPKKGRTGNRTYQERDIEVVRKIKELLWEQKFKIPGARAKLSGMSRLAKEEKEELYDEVRKELKDILDLMDHKSGRGAAR